MSKNKAGSALFLILLAVALFAALTYAITQSNRGDAVGIGKEEARTRSLEIINYSLRVKRAVDQLLLKGCSDTEISFDIVPPFWWPSTGQPPWNYSNPNSPSNGSCNVFDVNGGNIAWQLPPASGFGNTSYNLGFYYYRFVGNFSVLGVGTANTELSLNLPHLSNIICSAINDVLKINTPTSSTIPDDPFNGAVNHALSFQGVYAAPSSWPHSVGDDVAGLIGKNAACTKGYGGTYNNFYYILIDR